MLHDDEFYKGFKEKKCKFKVHKRVYVSKLESMINFDNLIVTI